MANKMEIEKDAVNQIDNRTQYIGSALIALAIITLSDSIQEGTKQISESLNRIARSGSNRW